MSAGRDPRLLWRAGRELGLAAAARWGVYRLGLTSGHYRRTLTAAQAALAALPDACCAPDFAALPPLPAPAVLRATLGEVGLATTRAAAAAVLAGQFRPYGGVPAPLAWTNQAAAPDWTQTRPPPGDLKDLWAAGRFTWAVELARAYHLEPDEALAQAFWRLVEAFWRANPPYRGPQWLSGQEAAVRLTALAWSGQVFAAATSSTPERLCQLGRWVALSAARLPPTLVYAAAQRNNHLLAEAVGLVTAGRLLPGVPQAARWLRQGRGALNAALLDQIQPEGVYIQHSSGYQRLALEIGLWAAALPGRDLLMPAARERLGAAARWLTGLVDPAGGAVNFGPQDGAVFLPLSALPQTDFRPSLQAAGRVFGLGAPFPPGPWDDWGLWLGTAPDGAAATPAVHPDVLRAPAGDAWAYLRSASFTSRPGHADLLHVDLWRGGLNWAGDPGTFRYTAPPPWDNALTVAAVHNTLTVAGEEPFQRIGRFLAVGTAPARRAGREAAPDGAWERLSAWHDAYARLGVRHQRRLARLSANGDAWLVEDWLVATPRRGARQPLTARLHWLLPDLPWQVEESEAGVRLRLLGATETLTLTLASETPAALQVARAGERLWGQGAVQPTAGWYAPTYGEKIPALALSLTVRGQLPLTFVSRWQFTARQG